MRILLVEDDKDVRYMFRRFMGDITSRIREEDRLTDALKAVTEEEFDVIILDLRLVDADKQHTLAAIPTLKRNSKASIIVVTGIMDPNIQKEATNAGADYCIVKDDDFNHNAKAFLLALHTAVIRHPRPHPGDDYLHHVAMLERLVQNVA